MESFADFRIDQIYIIVVKNENANFFFENPARQWDGFVLFTAGEGTFTAPDGTVHPFTRGTLTPFHRDDHYSFSASAPCSYVTSAFDFSDDSRAVSSLLPHILTCTEEQMETAVRMTEIWQSHQWDSPLRCRILLLQFYLTLLEHHAFPDTPPTNRAVALALEYIHANFRTNFKMEDLARFCSVSPSHLRTIFPAQVGETILDYREKLRIKAAREMLESGVFSVKEVAYELGYCDVYHFSKRFAARTGIPPARFARQKKANE